VTTVVEQRVDSFLQHALLVPDDDVRSLQLQQVLETVVAVDDAAVEIVQIDVAKAAAFKRNERTQIRRDHRQNVEHHPIRTSVRGREALHELQTLRELLADLLALGVPHRLLELFVELVEIDFGKKALHRFRAHAGNKAFAVLLLRFAVFDFVQQLRLRQRRVPGSMTM
jgi:hypothetical protein